MIKLLSKHRKDLLFIAVVMAAAVTISTLYGCAQMEKISGGPITGDSPIALETADTIGYGLGILAKKNPRLQEKVETYYSQIEAGGLTPAAVNGIMDALKVEGEEYQFLAYKLTRVLTRVGGKFEGGQLVDLKPIDPALIEAAKTAYLLAFKTTKK